MPVAGHDHSDATDDPHAKHGDGAIPAEAELIVSTDPAEVTAGEPAQLRLMIHQADGSMVRGFETIHEKQVHLIIVRDGLDEFAHIHPEIDSKGNITAEFTFPTGGEYLIYADHKPAGQPQNTARATVRVSGDEPPKPTLVANAPGQVSGDDLSALVSIEGSRSEGETEITFDLLDLAGKPVTDLETYLGARGHLVILSADGSEYVHSHPIHGKGANDGQVRFAAHFSESGLYKGWGQFQRAGQVLTVPFVMEVQ